MHPHGEKQNTVGSDDIRTKTAYRQKPFLVNVQAETSSWARPLLFLREQSARSPDRLQPVPPRVKALSGFAFSAWFIGRAAAGIWQRPFFIYFIYISARFLPPSRSSGCCPRSAPAVTLPAPRAPWIIPSAHRASGRVPLPPRRCPTSAIFLHSH